MRQYRERLTAPVVWWVLAVLFALSCGVAVGFYLGPALGIGTGVLALVLGVALLTSAGTRIEVDARRLRVGRAMIDFDYVAGSRVLDAAATARRTGPDADARAYLVLRPYAPTSVEVTLDDAADPAPYWLISTRHPQALADAIESARAATR